MFKKILSIYNKRSISLGINLFIFLIIYKNCIFAQELQEPIKSKHINDNNQDNNDISIYQSQDTDLSEDNLFEQTNSSISSLENDRIMAVESIKKSLDILKEAINNYESGKDDKSKILFQQVFDTFSKAPIDSHIYYRFRKDIEDLLNNLYILINPPINVNNNNNKSDIFLDENNEVVKRYIKIFSEGKPKKAILKAFELSGKYSDMILRLLHEYELPEDLVYLPVVESLYNINDRSRAGAVGLWQIMPERARALGLKVNFWVDERKDPEKSTHAACKYLKYLYNMFEDWHLALAAYNRGEYGLCRDLKFSKATNIEQISDRKAVPRETEHFVPQFIAIALIGHNPEKYGYEINFEKPIISDEVVIDSVIDLEIVAKCAKTNIETIRELNPSILTWCTPQNYPGFTLRLPFGTKDIFLENIKTVKDLNPSQGFIKYKIQKGDCLSKIAKRFGTSIRQLKEDNKIRDTEILKIGRVLIIRPHKKYLKVQ